MKVKKLDIINRFIPLAWDVFFIILIAFHIRIENVSLIVNDNYKFLIYVNIALNVLFLTLGSILSKKIVSKGRIGIFLVFLVLSLSIPFVLDNIDLFYTIIVISQGIDLVLIMYKMVYDSIFTEERLLNMKLPVNQFTDKRKWISKIVTIVSLVVFFVICFVVFYFNEVSLPALIILFFVGVIIAAIGQIISLSISLKPLDKYEKEFRKTLDFAKLKEQVNSLYEERLHDETINLMNIVLLEGACLTNEDEIHTYKSLVKYPKYQENVKKYNEAIFYFLLVTKQYKVLLERQKELSKSFKNKKLFQAFIKAINKEEYKYKFKKKMDNFTLKQKELLENIEDVL